MGYEFWWHYKNEQLCFRCGCWAQRAGLDVKPPSKHTQFVLK